MVVKELYDTGFGSRAVKVVRLEGFSFRLEALVFPLVNLTEDFVGLRGAGEKELGTTADGIVNVSNHDSHYFYGCFWHWCVGFVLELTRSDQEEDED